jgi:hypothetical protein
VDAFSLDWAGENNWLVPPINMISRTVNHIITCNARGTLVAPFWPSAPFWSMIFGNNAVIKSKIADILAFKPNSEIFLHYFNQKSIFGSDKFLSKVLVVRFE